MEQTVVAPDKWSGNFIYIWNWSVIKNMNEDEIEKLFQKMKKRWKKQQKIDFYQAAKLRDENIELKNIKSN